MTGIIERAVQPSTIGTERAAKLVDLILGELHAYPVGRDYFELEETQPQLFAEMRADLIEQVAKRLTQ